MELPHTGRAVSIARVRCVHVHCRDHSWSWCGRADDTLVSRCMDRTVSTEDRPSIAGCRQTENCLVRLTLQHTPAVAALKTASATSAAKDPCRAGMTPRRNCYLLQQANRYWPCAVVTHA